MLQSLRLHCVLALVFSAGLALAQDSSMLTMPPETLEGFVDVEGGKVWYEVVGSGDATPLLVLHGGPGAPHDYLEPLAGLSDERPVIFYDQLGCGRSDHPEDSTLWTLDRFVSEITNIRDALELNRVHILGHSWGGTLAAEYLLTKPEGVVSLILASPFLSSSRWTEDQNQLRAALPDSVREVLERNEEAGTIDSDEYQAALMVYYNRHLCRMDPWPEYAQRTMAAWSMDVYAVMWGSNEFKATGNLKDHERANRLGEIVVPTLFTCGRYDETPPETAKWFQSLLPGSEMVVFEQSSHMPHAEETEDYLKTVRDFLNRVESASKEGE